MKFRRKPIRDRRIRLNGISSVLLVQQQAQQNRM